MRVAVGDATPAPTATSRTVSGPGGVEQRIEQLVLGERQVALARGLVGDPPARPARRSHELAERVGEGLQLGVGRGPCGGCRSCPSGMPDRR